MKDFDIRGDIMEIEREIVEMTDPDFHIKTYIQDNGKLRLWSKYHYHPEIEIIYVIDGGMTFWISGDEIFVGRGRILLINSSIVHASSSSDDTYTKMCLLQFKPDFIYSSDKFPEFKYVSPFLGANSHSYQLIDSNMGEGFNSLTKCLNEIVIEFERKQIAYEIYIKSLIYQILTILYRNDVLNFDNTGADCRKNNDLMKLEKIIDYVEAHYREDISVEFACNMLNLNYYYFCRLFKKATGSSFIQYLNYVRISVAEKLLLTTDMPVTGIIYESGFSSLSYFNRIFKKYKNCSPTEYKKIMMEAKNRFTS